MNLKAIGAAALLLAAIGCSDSLYTGKPAASEDALQAGANASAFPANWQLVGTLALGQTSETVAYSNKPRYRAFALDAVPGQSVDVWVRSADGDALAWLLDDQFRVLAKNDDADGTTTDSHIALTLPTAPSSKYYVAFREYELQRAHFTVEFQRGAGLTVSASAGVYRYLGSLAGEAFATVNDGQAASTGATVKAGGVAAPYSAREGGYFFTNDETGALHAGALNEIDAALDGKSASVQVFIPGDFTVTSAPSQAQQGSAIALRWTASAQAQRYHVWIEDQSGHQLFSQFTADTALGVTAPAAPGQYYLKVFSLGASTAGSPDSYGWFGNTFDLRVVGLPFQFDGHVGVDRYRGFLNQESFFHVTDLGGSAQPGASVQVAGSALPWNAGYGGFFAGGAQSSLQAGAQNAVQIDALGGHTDLSIAIPADFTVTSVPSTAQQGSTISLAWTASVGAARYTVGITDASNNWLVSRDTTDTSMSVTLPSQTGHLMIKIFANGPSPANAPGVYGFMGNLFDLQVTQ